MDGMRAVARLDELPEGAKRLVMVGEDPVALFRVQGQVYALDNACPHRGGSLAQGDLEGGVIHCPLHAWSFDVRTGQCTSHAAAAVKRYTVQVEDGQVLVAAQSTP